MDLFINYWLGSIYSEPSQFLFYDQIMNKEKFIEDLLQEVK